MTRKSQDQQNSTRFDPDRPRQNDADSIAGPLWRSLDAVDDDHAEPSDLPPPFASPVTTLDRRRFLGLADASLALAGLPCCVRPPAEQILPYVEAPENRVSGQSVFYASALALDGYARGVLVETVMGRPIKIEGNPRHPASLGGTDIFTQAAVLDLWDPDRSRSLLHQGEPATWPELLQELEQARRQAQNTQGRGLAVLTGACSSPTLRAQMQTLLEQFPQAVWYQQAVLDEENQLQAAHAAFGEALLPRPRLARATLLLALDADPLGPGPDQLRNARAFARRRDPERAPDAFMRLYAAEPSPTLTGAAADHRLALRAGRIEGLTRRIGQALGLVLPDTPPQDDFDSPWLQTLLEDLHEHRGNALVIAGPHQPASVHRLVCAINDRLDAVGNTLDYAPSARATGQGGVGELTAALRAGEVDTLVMLDVNPVYSAPADLHFEDALQQAARTVHLGLYPDETARRCDWHIPLAHPLESWSDLCDSAGNASIQQPAIAPVYGGRNVHELIDALTQDLPRTAYQLVREHWQGRLSGEDFEHRWQQALRRGVVADTGLPTRSVKLRADWNRDLAAPDSVRAQGLELLFRPDPTVFDGRYANNAWLQELPKPISKLVWDNALLIAPDSAARLGLADGDLVRLQHAGRELLAPIWRLPGQARDSLTLHLGYGRRRAGRIGDGLGVDANALRGADHLWRVAPVTLQPGGSRRELVTTQQHQVMEGRDLLRTATLAAYRANPPTPPEPRELPSLYPRPEGSNHAWGMSIDLGACIGCAACTIACQAENNIPVVGKQEVQRGREMHWIRVDRYYEGPSQDPRILFQPVPCMHCEQAPCEVVCPVEATLHDSEGLNLQVYNRCVGTRFCSNNCPYKVRRFNFLQYSQTDQPALAAQHNPQVTVRQRGVMEKCTYCLQRINAARLQAQKRGRAMRDGDVVTACQGVCPTNAILFGDLNDPDSRVSRAKRSPRDYVLLRELNTRPRTSYRLRLSNPAAALQDEDA